MNGNGSAHADTDEHDYLSDPEVNPDLDTDFCPLRQRVVPKSMMGRPLPSPARDGFEWPRKRDAEAAELAAFDARLAEHRRRFCNGCGFPKRPVFKNQLPKHPGEFRIYAKLIRSLVQEVERVEAAMAAKEKGQ